MHVQLTRENADRLLRLSIQCDRPVGALANLIVQAVVEAGIAETIEPRVRGTVSPRDTKPRRRRWRPVEAPWHVSDGWRVRV